jgi:outer membrane lipoprotein LolB
MSVAFELQGNGDNGELRLNSPLGTRLASARWSPGVAVLARSDGEQRFADLDELSRRALGENLPLAALPDWLAGRPWAGALHTPAATGFEQLGWHVELARRSEGWVEARRAAPPAVWVRVKLEESAP